MAAALPRRARACQGQLLVARLFGSDVGHRYDEPLDLSPAAEIDDISAVATGIGANIGGGARVGTVIGEQPNGFERSCPIENIWLRHGRRLIALHNLCYDDVG